jgi:peroxiredoxin
MAKFLEAGTAAPNFSLPVAGDQTITLSEFKGKPVILAFYPADWSPICSDQMALYNELLPEFQKYQAEIFGISVDGCWCHGAFAKDHHLHFPLLSDFEPKGSVAKKYGAYRDQAGICERALFVIDKDGVISWSYLSPLKENPGADGILEALKNLPHNGVGKK